MGETWAEEERLRASAIVALRNSGLLTTERIERALRTVVRSRFLKGVHCTGNLYDLEVGMPVKCNDEGLPLSSATCMAFIAEMLERAALEPGHNVCEIGTGTGYNAALLSEIVGPGGVVTSLEVDQESADRAAERLGGDYPNVRICWADGAEGVPPDCEYDCILATVAMPEVPGIWHDRLRPGGRLVSIVRGLSWCFLLQGRKIGASVHVDTFCSFGQWDRARDHTGASLAGGWFERGRCAGGHCASGGVSEPKSLALGVVRSLPVALPEGCVIGASGLRDPRRHALWTATHLHCGLPWEFRGRNIHLSRKAMGNDLVTVDALASADSGLVIDQNDLSKVTILGNQTLYRSLCDVLESLRSADPAADRFAIRGRILKHGGQAEILAASLCSWVRGGRGADLLLSLTQE